MTYRIVLLLCLGPLLSFMPRAEHNVTLTFCYEDKQLLPYYTGEGHAAAYLPGVTIEHLQASAAAAGNIRLAFVRFPWRRCLQKLEQNEVDALVATYLPQRSDFAVYPMTADGKPDPARAMSRHATCLVHRADNDIQHKITQQHGGLVVSRPLGHSNPDYPAGISVVQVHSQQQALELVLSGRVDATTTLCKVNGVAGADRQSLRKPLRLVYPPLYETTGYLVFSKGFYQRHPALAEQLWQLLGRTIEPQRYYDYLHYPDM
ncbi:ABC transporter substrate-binding protein [Rheinheimera sp.]|uniref:substrate-binding periplasmic protein n=1 Tax=Rheinheimera sp. TaxID=1869214 RepID=UPI002734C1B0|nr:amino acid ABC transporter [Rheinheimera sp.]MDP2713910.1 amino acid ABC transporter [Rheinheimera sp.]